MAQSPPRADAKQLFAAVRAAVHALSGTAERGRGVELESVAPERIARYLRAVVTMMSAGPSSTRSGPYCEAITAVSAACADLDAGDLPGAYLALRVADTALHEAATA